MYQNDIRVPHDYNSTAININNKNTDPNAALVRLFNDKIILRLTLNQTVSEQLLNEIAAILPQNEILPRPESKRDGTRFRYSFDIKTKNHELFNKNLEQYKVNNPQLDIFAEPVNESILNKIANSLNLKNLIFPAGTTIRFTLDANIDPKQFKEDLESYLPDEELPNVEYIGDKRFRRFKIHFNINNMTTFQTNLSKFKEDFNTTDINEEYDKRTVRSYVNLIVWIIVIVFGITRIMGLDIIQWFQDLLKNP